MRERERERKRNRDKECQREFTCKTSDGLDMDLKEAK